MVSPALTTLSLALLRFPGFLELSFDQTDRQSRRIHWNIELLEQVAQAANMVLMTVGQKNPPHFFPILHHIGKIGDNQIDAGHIVVREGKSAVNNDNILLRLDHRHVFADLPEAAERDDANRIFRFCSALAGTASDFLGSGQGCAAAISAAGGLAAAS